MCTLFLGFLQNCFLLNKVKSLNTDISARLFLGTVTNQNAVATQVCLANLISEFPVLTISLNKVIILIEQIVQALCKCLI
jgi:hypothetical protein